MVGRRHGVSSKRLEASKSRPPRVTGGTGSRRGSRWGYLGRRREEQDQLAGAVQGEDRSSSPRPREWENRSSSPGRRKGEKKERLAGEGGSTGLQVRLREDERQIETDRRPRSVRSWKRGGN